MTGFIRNFEKLNFTPKLSAFCFSQGQTSKYDRLAHYYVQKHGTNILFYYVFLIGSAVPIRGNSTLVSRTVFLTFLNFFLVLLPHEVENSCHPPEKIANFAPKRFILSLGQLF